MTSRSATVGWSPVIRTPRGVDLGWLRKPLPRAGASRPNGQRLILHGWTLRVTGTVLGLTGYLLFRAGLTSDQMARMPTALWWVRAVGGLVGLLLGLRLWAAGRRLVVRGRRRRAEAIDSFESLSGTRYVLYLRPFTNDELMAVLNTDVQGGGAQVQSWFFLSGLTQEELLVRRFARFGRVVAIGRPGELLPPVGAVRGQLPPDDWQGTVSSLIAEAHVVLMAAGPGPGTVWEFTEAVRCLDPTRLVLLVYCDVETYDRFRKAVAKEYRQRTISEPQPPDRPWPPLPTLPDYPPLARPDRPLWEVALNGGRERLRWDFFLKGFVAFTPDWTAAFTRFDPTTRRVPSLVTLRRLVTRGFQPVLAQLDALPEPTRSVLPSADGEVD